MLKALIVGALANYHTLKSKECMAHYEDVSASCKMNLCSDESSYYAPVLQMSLLLINTLEREVL